MLEGAVMEYAKWFIGIVSIMFIAVAVIFMFKLNEVNSFQQEVNYQIERHGGLTQEAKVELNQHAKMAYGGCLAESSEYGADCLFPEPEGVESSGFFVREYKVEEEDLNGDGDYNDENETTRYYYDRENDEKARYGTTIHYVITRQIGHIGDTSFFEPAVTGTSSSRVRGTVSE